MPKEQHHCRVVVAGSRSFRDFQLLTTKLDRILRGLHDVEIVSGGARGADALGERYARERSLSCRVFPADWTHFGKRAGFLRNELMAGYATHVVVFWDRRSPGTRSMIELAERHGLPLRVVKF